MSVSVPPRSGHGTVREAIDRMAETRGDAVFLIDPEGPRRRTFRQLRERASEFGSRLLARGVRPGDRVASLLENGLFAAESLLGAMYGGFVAVPLNPSAGPEEIGLALDQSLPKVLLVGPESRGLVHVLEPATRRLFMESEIEIDDFDVVEGEHGEARIPRATRSDVLETDDALIAYTSGSTGKPKGVLMSHRNVVAGGWNTVDAHRLSEGDRSLCVLPLFHMNAQIVTLTSTLLSGGSVVLPLRFSAARFWGWMHEERCTWSALVPSLISQLLNLADTESRTEERAHVRFLRSSSAPLPPEIHLEFEERFGLPLIEAMGSTEAGGAVFSNPLGPDGRRIGSPGIPWGFECRVLDDSGGELPPLRTGEIQVRGPSVMKGYYGDPAATAEVLDADGWLRTGDLGFRDADGYLFIQGRSKEIINRGGEKIAPREIDEALSRHPAVLEAAAVGMPDPVLGEDAVACVVRRAFRDVGEVELLELCRRTLGPAKSPSRVYFLDDLPRGPSGKVKRSGLAERIAASRPARREAAASGSAESHTGGRPIEAELAALWSELCPAGSSTRSDDNFFGQGGDSLTAMRMLPRLSERFGIELPLSFFFAHPTLGSQAAAIVELLGDTPTRAPAPEAAGPRREKGEEGAVLPLSPAQKRLWFLDQFDPDPPVYREAEAFRLTGPLDVAALEAALHAVAARHPALRTSIRGDRDGPVQVIHEVRPLRLEKTSLRQIEESRREAELASRLTAEVWKPLDLTDGLARASLYEMAPDEHVLSIVLHHLICDGWSMGILHRDLARFYAAHRQGRACEIEPLPLPAAPLATPALTTEGDEEASEHVAYWRKRLRGASELLDLPTDRPRPRVMSHRGATLPVEIDAALAGKLRAVARQERLSLFTVMTAAFTVLLSRYAGQTDIVLGILVANRNRRELAPVVGLLVDTLVLRTDLSGDPSFREALVRTGRRFAEAIAHRAVGFEKIVKLVNPRRRLDHDPLFQVAVNWRDRDFHIQQLELDGLRVAPVEYPKGTTRFDLHLSLIDAGDRIHGKVEYRTDLWDPSTIGKLIGAYRGVLEAVVEDRERRISELAAMTGAEPGRALAE